MNDKLSWNLIYLKKWDIHPIQNRNIVAELSYADIRGDRKQNQEHTGYRKIKTAPLFNLTRNVTSRWFENTRGNWNVFLVVWEIQVKRAKVLKLWNNYSKKRKNVRIALSKTAANVDYREIEINVTDIR